MKHYNLIDTSLLYPHHYEGRKHSLKYLAQQYLKLSIQDGEHDSTQDALVALKLVQLCLKNGNLVLSTH